MLDLTGLDDAHLIALSKALHECRFCEVTNDPVVWASPLVVDLHEWVLAEQRRRDADSVRTVDWDRWLNWAGRDEAKTVVRRLREDRKFLNLVIDDPELLRNALRPFRVQDSDLDNMIRSARSES